MMLREADVIDSVSAARRLDGAKKRLNDGLNLAKLCERGDLKHRAGGQLALPEMRDE